MSDGVWIAEQLKAGIPFAVCSFPGDGPSWQRFEMQAGRLCSTGGDEFVVQPYGRRFGRQSQVETVEEQHILAVTNAINAIRNGRAGKVIISRIKHIPRAAARSLDGICEHLRGLYPNAFISCYFHPDHGLWVGATPELLLAKQGNDFTTVALAGTQKLAPGQSPGDLHWNKKLVHEQKVVADFITSALDIEGIAGLAANGPFTANAGPIAHLKTIFTFTSDRTADDIADILHPTPAVCGMPVQAAKELISKLEAHERRLYTGYLGVKHASGDASYFVNLRCMQVFDDHFELYIGGGITADSDPVEEWEETENKAEVLIKAL